MKMKRMKKMKFIDFNDTIREEWLVELNFVYSILSSMLLLLSWRECVDAHCFMYCIIASKQCKEKQYSDVIWRQLCIFQDDIIDYCYAILSFSLSAKHNFNLIGQV